jgi:acyl-CoA dehydrogenase
MATVFALVADVSMFMLGGDLKRRERISARLGDVLSQLYLISATLKRFEDEGRAASDLPLVRWGVEDALLQAQQAIDGVLANFPRRVPAALLRMLAFPFGMPHRAPADRIGNDVAQLLQTPGAARERLLAGSYVPRVDVDTIGYGELAFELTPGVSAIERRLRDAIRQGQLAPLPQNLAGLGAWAQTAQQLALIDADERKLLEDYARYAAEVVRVDDFAADFGMLADLQQRKERLDKSVEIAA